jgi:hypothetical protein
MPQCTAHQVPEQAFSPPLPSDRNRLDAKCGYALSPEKQPALIQADIRNQPVLTPPSESDDGRVMSQSIQRRDIDLEYVAD